MNLQIKCHKLEFDIDTYPIEIVIDGPYWHILNLLIKRQRLDCVIKFYLDIDIYPQEMYLTQDKYIRDTYPIEIIIDGPYCIQFFFKSSDKAPQIGLCYWYFI